ncbi:hypothetical protein [Piscinibacter sp.]|uniref:hypothetical protein n=1 Tax=Piscinibacter sp. TaxID=1903157 RepID=UPI00355945D7
MTMLNAAQHLRSTLQWLPLNTPASASVALGHDDTPANTVSVALSQYDFSMAAEYLFTWSTRS